MDGHVLENDIPILNPWYVCLSDWLSLIDKIKQKD